MTDALADLLRACHAAKVAATAEDVLDAAWLTRWMTPAPAAPKPASEASPVEPEHQQPKPELPPLEELPQEPFPPEVAPPPIEVVDEPLELSPEPEPELEESDESVGVYLPSTTNQGGTAGRVFRAPGAPALPRALEIARALRPLSRKVASRTRFVLDEAETIRRFADERVCNPAVRPATERWLRLALVIDTGAGSDLWRETAHEFRSLLTSLGAFRDVRTWSLDTGTNPPRLSPGTSTESVSRKPKELIDPVGRTLIVVLSPCIASGWHDGGVAKLLTEWGDRGPVVLVPLLPEYLWPRTALAGATTVQISTADASTANRLLKFTRPGAWPGEEMPTGTPLPVAVLEPAALRRWARLVAGHSHAETTGFLLDTEPASAPQEAPFFANPGARVEQFRQTASPLARRLVRLLAAAPVISLPIIRLVREALLPQAGQPQEAEVLFGGLLMRLPESTASDPRFDFHPGVRELLLDALPTDESVPVLQAVSEYLGEHLASGRTFRAVLASPASAAGELVADASPFAQIAAEVLRRAGGDYAKLVSNRKPPPGTSGQSKTDALSQANDAKSLAETLPRPFGDYVLESVISDGPVNVVYRVNDARGRRTAPPVALKTPRAGAACTPEVRTAIQREAEVLARLAELQLTNVCHVFDVGEIDGCPFFTMEYVHGETLTSYWAREGKRDGPWEAVNLIHSLAVALARVHALTLDGQPILHRNITPENILIVLGESEPRFVLIDFGPRLAGTELGYAPPEELLPDWDGHSITPRSDVYSLGAVLYRLLTGSAPFTGNYEELLENDSASPPSSFDPALAPFDELCRRALARHPDDRYQSMRAFADALVQTYRKSEVPESPDRDSAEVSQNPPAADELHGKPQELQAPVRDLDATDADFTDPTGKTEGEAPAVVQAELAAFTATQTDPLRYTAQPSWRNSLPLNRPIRLGRDPEFCDWAVPNDSLISRFHAILEWNGSVLTVKRRGAQPPTFPNPPANQLWYKNKPSEQCTVKPGEWFVIGHTRFALHRTLVEVDVTPDATITEGLALSDAVRESRMNPATVLRAIERLQRTIQLNPNNPQTFWQPLLAAVMEALPHVELASVIHVPGDDQTPGRSLLDRISTVESMIPPSRDRRLKTPRLNGDLVHKAVNVRRASRLELSDFEYYTAGFDDPEADWAICSPLPDGSRYALYLAGNVNWQWDVPKDSSFEEQVRNELTRYEKVAGLLLAIIAENRLRIRREAQIQAMRRALPPAIREQATNAEELERVLAPREQEITALYCNLRDYASYATQNTGGLLRSQREVSEALDARAKAITESGGYVIGRNGEAMLGFWGWPAPLENQVEVVARLLTQSPPHRGLTQLRLALGLAHGDAVVGQLSPHDPVIGAYGPVIDLSARLAGLARVFGVGIVISEAVATRLQTADPAGDRWHIRKLGRIRIPGHPALRISELNWARGGHWLAQTNYRDLLTLWHEAVEFFTGGNWKQAREALKADFPNDDVSRYLQRFMSRTNGSPPDNWDGSFHLLQEE